MASAAHYSAGGDEAGTLDLPDGVFGVEPNAHAVWEAVVNFQANQRQGTVKVKTRGEVSRSNSKPWRQKGTGRARAGTFRSPLWVGGGRIHGPVPREHAYRLPRKVRRLALRSALTDRANEGRVIVIDSIELPEIRTRAAIALLEKLGVREHKVLVLAEEPADNLVLSVRNLPNVVALAAREVNTYTVVAAEWIVITKGGLQQLQEVFG